MEKGTEVIARWTYNGRKCQMRMFFQHEFTDGKVLLSRKRDGRGCTVLVVGAKLEPVEGVAA